MTDHEGKKNHLRDYWRVAWQGKWTVLSIATVVVTLVAVATFLQTPIYRATASIEIQPRAKSINPNADFARLGASSFGWSAEDRYLNTQMEIIRSPQIGSETLKSLGFEDLPQFAAASNPGGVLASRISLRLVPDTYVLKVSLEDADPKLAKKLVNGIATTYIDSNVREAVKNARRVIDELYAQVEPMQKDIVAKEEALVELARTANYFAPDEQESSIGTRIAQLETELTSAQISLGEQKAVIDAIEEIERLGGSFESVSVVAEDPIIISLKEQALQAEQQVEELSATFRKDHPTRQAAAAKLAELPRKIAAETAKIIDKAKTEYAVEQRRAADLEQRLQTMREQGLDLSQDISRIEAAKKELAEQRRIYELVTSKIQEIDLNRETLINNIRLLQPADEPRSPVRPVKSLNLAAGILLGLFLGVGTAFFIDYLDNTIRDPEDIERYLGLPLLALIPKSDDPNSAISREAQQTLRTGILFASKGRSLKVIHVTSAGPGEGKSRTAVQLAKTLAAAGDHVLLIDADLRRPTVHKHMGISRDSGLCNYMMSAEGGDTWRQYLKRSNDVESLHVLASGPLPPKPVELFGSARFADLITQLKRVYDWVVIDSPPVASLADSVVLGSLAEMSILLIKHRQNDRELVRRSVESLNKVGTNLIGAVLNAVDVRHSAYSHYYYSYETVEPETEARSTKSQSRA